MLTGSTELFRGRESRFSPPACCSGLAHPDAARRLRHQITTPVTDSAATTSPMTNQMRPGSPTIRPECSGNCACTKMSAAVPTHGSRADRASVLAVVVELRRADAAGAMIVAGSKKAAA